SGAPDPVEAGTAPVEASAPDPAERLASLTAFATLGAITTAQHVAGVIVASIPDADAELVAEETLALLSVVTSRSLREDAAASGALLSLTLTFRDYMVGTQIIGQGTSESLEEVTDAQAASYQRIGRKLSFYEAHFPGGRLVGPRALRDKMELWMGRVSPPGLPEMPGQRLEKLGLVDVVNTHVNLVRAFISQ
ncbi:MAG: hypothetical protein HKN29_16215, partial [Rhodothermales bacterium]|nr:hypothetical protein [Rhodothermales bacterium]